MPIKRSFPSQLVTYLVIGFSVVAVVRALLSAGERPVCGVPDGAGGAGRSLRARLPRGRALYRPCSALPLVCLVINSDQYDFFYLTPFTVEQWFVDLSLRLWILRGESINKAEY